MSKKIKLNNVSDYESVQSEVKALVRDSYEKLTKNVSICFSEAEQLFMVGILNEFGYITFQNGTATIESFNSTLTITHHPVHGFDEYDLFGFELTLVNRDFEHKISKTIFASCDNYREDCDVFGDTYDNEIRLLAKEGIPSVYFSLNDLRVNPTKCVQRTINALNCLVVRDAYGQTGNSELLTVLEETSV